MATETTARRVLVGLILVAILAAGLVLRPFGEALFFAAVLAGTLSSLQSRLARKLRNRPQLASGILCTGVVLSIVLPLGGISAFVVKETMVGARFVVDTVKSDGMQGLIEELPEPVQRSLDRVLEYFPMAEEGLDETMQKQASAQGGKAAGFVTAALAATGGVVLQTVMMLIALFFLLVDGPDLVDWMEQVAPLRPGQTKEILLEFKKVSASVLVSSIATAGVQALAALVGYLIAGVPHAFFFTTMTFFLAFIPAIGAGGVCLIAALLIFVQGHPGMAIFLALWGIVVVGLVDNLIKPLLVKRGMHMHGAIVFFALLGGLAAFGTVGLLLGPLIIAAFLALVRIYQRDFPSRMSVPPRA